MKLEHTKNAESLIRGCSVAQQVHLLSQLRVLGNSFHRNSLSPHPRPLSTEVLAQTIGKLPKHHVSASAKSRDVVVIVANAPAGDVGREEVREGEGGAQEGERRKGQRGGSVPPPVVVPTYRPLRGRWVWQDS